jgi:hypothetical protein
MMSAFEEAVANGISVEDYNKVFLEELNNLINDLQEKEKVSDNAMRLITKSFERGMNLGMSLVAKTILREHLQEESDDSTKH